MLRIQCHPRRYQKVLYLPLHSAGHHQVRCLRCYQPASPAAFHHYRLHLVPLRLGLHHLAPRRLVPRHLGFATWGSARTATHVFFCNSCIIRNCNLFFFSCQIDHGRCLSTWCFSSRYSARTAITVCAICRICTVCRICTICRICAVCTI